MFLYVNGFKVDNFPQDQTNAGSNIYMFLIINLSQGDTNTLLGYTAGSSLRSKAYR